MGIYLIELTGTTAQTDGVNTWYFRYDGDTPIGLEFNGVEYYYVTNLQGDIIAILNDSGTCVAEYSYDAWGNCTVTKDTNTIALDNPLRYRGYYYDFDSGLYYLQSRFYDANTGRFINADEPTLIGANGGMVSNNLFAYCDNNPVINIDPSGYGKTVVFYYYASRGSLAHFAEKSAYFSFYSSNVESHVVYSAKQFVTSWNRLKGNIDNIYLYLHGDPGQLNFQGGDDILGFSKGRKYNKYYSLYSLEKKTINNAFFV